MSQGGANNNSGSGASPLETLTANSGGAVSPDGAFNIDVLGNNATGIDIVGTPASNLLTVMGLDASETQQGTVELATGAETTTGTSTSLAVHPSGLDTKLGPQTSNGLIYGQGGAGTNLASLAEATNGQIPIGSTGNPPVLSTLTGSENISVTNGSGSITLDLTSDAFDAAVSGWNGSLLETAAVTVTSDGATITCSVEQSGGGDLTVVFSDGFYDWDTTPADTVTLTAGTDTEPQINYVYFLQSTKTLTASTVSFPSAEYAPIATVICQSAASLQTDGAYKVHVWTDHVTGTDDQGHISHLNYWIRQQNATYVSGIVQSFTITTNVGVPDNVNIDTTAGTVLQLHPHTFPAFTTTHDYYVINDFTTPYTVVTDLNALLTDSTGASMSGRYFSLVLWGVVSEDTTDCKLFINLPVGSYTNSSDVVADPNSYATFTIPADYTGTGFLIARWDLRHQVASGGTWTSVQETDLRGLVPSLVPGGTTATPQEFPDNLFRIFDDGDDTKKIAFQASGITTANTRTITMIDGDLDLNTVSNSFPTDGGTAAPTANALTIAGGTGITTSGAATTVTVNLDSPVAVANGGTGTTTLTDHGILLGSGTAAITPTAAPTDGQLLIGSTGVDPVLGSLTSSGSSITVTGGAGTLNIDIAAPVSVANGGTGATTLTDHGVLVGSGTGAITPLAVGTTGQLLVGASGSDPAFASSANANFSFTSSTAGSPRVLTVTNTDNTNTGSHANLLAESGGASGGDPFVRMSVSGAQDYSFGVDNSDSDSLKINDDASPSTGNNLWRMSSAGERTIALQPRFYAYVSSNITNVTGDGTSYTVVFDTEDLDVGADYNNASGVFTAPVAGTYLFTASVTVSGLTSSHVNGFWQITTAVSKTRSSRFAQGDFGAMASGTANYCASGNLIVNLAASDTVQVTIEISGGTLVVDVIGTSAGQSNFSGALLF